MVDQPPDRADSDEVSPTDMSPDAPRPARGNAPGAVEVGSGGETTGYPARYSGDAGPARPPSGPAPKDSWRRRSAAGAILTGFALGLQEALEPRREEPSIMMETSGDPPTDLPVEAEVGQIRAADNVVTIRPWLFSQDDGRDGQDAGTAHGSTSGTGSPGDPTGEPPPR